MLRARLCDARTSDENMMPGRIISTVLYVAGVALIAAAAATYVTRWGWL